MRSLATDDGHADDDLLTDLAHGLLDDDEADACLSHLSMCAACEERFREHVRSRERARATPVPGAEGSTGAGWSYGKRAAPIAIAAALLLVVLVPLATRDRFADVPEYWLPVDRGEVSLRSTTASDPVTGLRSALQVYARGDAAGALAMLESAEVPESYRHLRDLFRASAMLLTDRPRRAREVLESLPITTMPEPWRDRASWLLYAALRRTGARDEADDLLGSLAALPGEIGDLARAEVKRRGGGRVAEAGPRTQ